jgi:hypothetical protein
MNDVNVRVTMKGSMKRGVMVSNTFRMDQDEANRFVLGIQDLPHIAKIDMIDIGAIHGMSAEKSTEFVKMLGGL